MIGWIVGWACVDARAARLLGLLAFALTSVQARAQTIDDVTMLVRGNDTIARVAFNATVRFLQQTPTSAADTYRISFQLLATDESVLKQSTEEVRQFRASGTLPEFTISYAPMAGRQTRVLALQLRRRLAVQVRQGPSSKTIDITFRGVQAVTSETTQVSPAGEAQPVASASVASLPVAPPAPMPEAPEASPEPMTDLDRQGEELINRAREALAAKKYPDAVSALNRLLLLPPNKFSKDAQELAGVAWERAGDAGKARVEYELYLKLFPEGEGAQRVAQRLADLEGSPANTPGTALVQPKKDAGGRNEPAKFLAGNLAQYYYGGKAKSQSLVNLAAGIDQSTLSKTTESAIVTSVDLGGRYASADAETRVVLRGTGSSNLSSDSHSASLLNAAYVDYKRNAGLAVRVGRQTPIGGGLLGLFDGMSLTYPVSEKFNFDLMGGVPANALVSAPARRLLAAVLNGEGIFERWGGNIYLVNETTEGITNRRAVGAELRYSGEQWSTYSLIDYDTYLRKLNAVSLQESVQLPAQTTVTLLLDARKAPTLALTNALIAFGGTSLAGLVRDQTLAVVREAAFSTSATAKQGLLSISRPVSERWQLSMDLRYSAVGALPAIPGTLFEATPATGAQRGFTAQLTGTNLYSPRDINSLNFSVLSSPTFKGRQIAYNNLTGLQENTFTVEPSISFYSQSGNDGIKISRWTPGLRLTHRASRRTSLLGETIVERSTTDGPTNHGTASSVFFYLGYRYELF